MAAPVNDPGDEVYGLKGILNKQPQTIATAVVAVLNLFIITGAVHWSPEAVGAGNVALVSVLSLFVKAKSVTVTEANTKAATAVATTKADITTFIASQANGSPPPPPPAPPKLMGMENPPSIDLAAQRAGWNSADGPAPYQHALPPPDAEIDPALAQANPIQMVAPPPARIALRQAIKASAPVKKAPAKKAAPRKRGAR